VDAELLQESNERKELTQRTINYTFWLTENSMFMFRNFINALGLDEDHSFRENIANAPGCEVLAVLTQQPSQRGDTIFNQIDSFTSVDTQE